MVNEHGILRANPCDGHISTRWSCRVGDVTKIQEWATLRPRDQGRVADGDQIFWDFFLSFFVRGEGRRITHRWTKEERNTIPICIPKLPVRMERGDSSAQVWISFCLLATGVSSESQRGPEWEGGVLWFSDTKLGYCWWSGRPLKKKKRPELLKAVRHFQRCWEPGSGGRRAAGRPSTAPAVGRSIGRSVCLSVGRSAFQTSVLCWVCNASSSSPDKSYWKHYLFHQ